MEIAALAVVFVLAILGLTFLIRFAALKIITFKDSKESFLVVLLRPGKVESTLMAAVEETEWLGRYIKAIAVDCGLQGEERIIAEKYCSESGFLLCYPDKVGRIVNKYFIQTGESDG